MKTVQWGMKERFALLQKYGRPTAIPFIQVTPRYTEESVEGRPKLTGIYHLSVNIQLSKEDPVSEQSPEVIVIDDLEITDDNAYFEYAVPFTIDFPPEAKSPVTFKTLNPTSEIEANGTFNVMWEVECSYEEAGIEKLRQEDEIESKKESEIHNKQDIDEKVVNRQSGNEVTDRADTKEKKVDLITQTATKTNEIEIIEFMSGLEDGISKTSFRLNDIFI